MKRCPQCNRTYADETYSFCLADGALLSASYDPNATLIIPGPPNSSTAPTELFPHPMPHPTFNPETLEGLSEEEKRLHKDANRFAKLLVSEIKIYNDVKVELGRQNKDLYDRLKEDIDISYEMYNKRAHPDVKEVFDYFDYQIVMYLCEGDSSKLGCNYKFHK